MAESARKALEAVGLQAGRGRRVLAASAAVASIAIAAQLSVPLPFTPVPWTLQPLAVLVVGGLLGPRLGAVCAASYLLVGAIGLPVFTPGGAPGILRFAGPTGGYLLAYPVAAYLVGALAGASPNTWRAGLATLAGLAVIHAGGVAHLATVQGSLAEAALLGSLPFLVGDAVKVVIAALLVRRFAAPLRARL